MPPLPPPLPPLLLPTAADRSGMDYDYANLAAAMDSGDDSDAAGASDSDVEGSDDDEPGFGSKFVAAEAEGDSDGSSDSGSEDGEEPEGGTFSDMSDSEGEEGSDLDGPSGSGSEDEGDSSDGGFEAELAAEDWSEGERDSAACLGCSVACWVRLRLCFELGRRCAVHYVASLCSAAALPRSMAGGLWVCLLLGLAVNRRQHPVHWHGIMYSS